MYLKPKSITRQIAPLVLLANWIPLAIAQSPVWSGSVTASYQYHTLKHPTGIGYTGWLYRGRPGLIIADTGNHLIRSFDMLAGTLSVLAGNGTAGYANGNLTAAEFDNPTGIEVVPGIDRNPTTGATYYWNTIYVADTSNNVIRRFCVGSPYNLHDTPCSSFSFNFVETYAGNHTRGYVNGSLLSAEFAGLAGVPMSSGGYAVDAANHVVRSIGSSVSTYAGTGTPGFVNGPISSAQFNTPTQLKAVGGALYITDAGNSVIRKVSGGNVTTFAGSGQIGYHDGPPGTAKFAWPTSIEYNSADSYFYVTDPINNVIRRIDSSGNVSTYAGAPTSGYVDGSLSQARFNNPTDLVIVNGLMYVTDTNNNCVRLIDMKAGVVSTYIN